MDEPTPIKKEFREVVQELIPYGEDKKELAFWEGIFDDLAREEQVEVLQNLKAELEALRNQKDS